MQTQSALIEKQALPAINIKRLEKRFGDNYAVAGVDMEVPTGAFLVLLGPSGCGKTTILRMLAGLEEPTNGEIHFGDQQIASGKSGIIVSPGDRDAGMVFQSYALWPHKTVQENVEWPLKIKQWSADERRERVKEVLELLSIDDLAARYPGEISGGQQQRVAIARTIAPKPKVLLFDEPLSNLDAKLRAEMRTELLRIHRITGATSVYVTHDQVEAMTMASHVAVMNHGKVEQFGSPRTLYEAPATRFVATFVGTPPANLVHAHIENERYMYKQIDLGPAKPSTTDTTQWLMYRAEALKLSHTPDERRIAVTFAEGTPVAGRFIVTVWDEHQRISVVADQLPEAQLGDELYLEFPERPTMVYEN